MEIKHSNRQKFYVVFEGIRTRVYSNWVDCAPRVLGVRGSLYKSFPTEDQAVEAFKKYMISKGQEYDSGWSDDVDSYSESSNGEISSRYPKMKKCRNVE
ncbi:hypothetical protein C2S51_025609 [Perilla frutescens var. frutescens]|nr:hypothetical protein C2S51_025609 [Perilla frutescens var. frutescens]